MHPYIYHQLTQSKMADLHRQAGHRRFVEAVRQARPKRSRTSRIIRGTGPVGVPLVLAVAAGGNRCGDSEQAGLASA